MGAAGPRSQRALRIAPSGFRNLRDAEVELGAAPVTVVVGANGAGKTNLLEALYFGVVGRSCRTRRERETIRHGAEVARVEIEIDTEPPGRELATAITRGGERRRNVDGQRVEPAQADRARPPVAVFLPERLELIKGSPGSRRGHIDALAAALHPARTPARPEYSRALAQRNALLGRVRAGRSASNELDAWDAALARAGFELVRARSDALEGLREPAARHFARLGGEGALEVAYAPRSEAQSAEELERELAERRERDVERGFTTHGPHLDEVRLARDGRALRTYGSQGQQRLAVLALLLAERELLLEARGAAPLLLLDDVMSELDPRRRAGLAESVADGQSVITATEPEHVPAGASEQELLRVEDGVVEGAGR